MLEVGTKVKYSNKEWRVAGLNTVNGNVYLERGASGPDEKGGVNCCTVLEGKAGELRAI